LIQPKNSTSAALDHSLHEHSTKEMSFFIVSSVTVKRSFSSIFLFPKSPTFPSKSCNRSPGTGQVIKAFAHTQKSFQPTSSKFFEGFFANSIKYPLFSIAFFVNLFYLSVSDVTPILLLTQSTLSSIDLSIYPTCSNIRQSQ